MADNKHTKGDLQQMQAVPLAGKILMTKRRIREWYDHFDGQVYVSFSGGKDSTVLKHIVDSMYSDIPAGLSILGWNIPKYSGSSGRSKLGNMTASIQTWKSSAPKCGSMKSSRSTGIQSHPSLLRGTSRLQGETQTAKGQNGSVARNGRNL